MSSNQTLQVKWKGTSFDVTLSSNDTVLDCKKILQEWTKVNVAAQKLVGLLPGGKLPSDQATLSSLKLKNPQKVMLIGTSQLEADEHQRQELVLIEERRENERLETERKQQEALLKVHEEGYREREELLRKQEYTEHRRNQLQDEIEKETDERAQIAFSYPSFSSAFANKVEIENSDKIILPPSSLQDVVNKKLPLPLTFEISNRDFSLSNASSSMSSTCAISKYREHLDQLVDSSQIANNDMIYIAHGSVLEFSSSSEMCFLPYWMMEKLKLNEGDTVSLRNVKLKKGEYAKLHSMSKGWLEIEEKTRKAILEHNLRNYQSLTIGDKIRVIFADHSFDFIVMELKPESAVSIIDTDISVDVSVEPTLEEEEEEKEEILEIGKILRTVVPFHRYKYFSVNVYNPAMFGIEITLNSIHGDAALYISESIRKPTQLDYTWCSQSVGRCQIVVDQSDPRYRLGSFSIGVFGYKEDTEFELSVLPVTKSNATGVQLLDFLEINEEQSQFCDNCQKRIPHASYEIHRLTCVRRNYRCEKCAKVMLIEEKEKHLELAHTMLTCACGLSFEQQSLHLHKESECLLRLVKCIYCPMKVPLKDRGLHQEYCGSRTIQCKYCNCLLKRREMKIHLSREHQIHLEEIDEISELEHFR